MPNIPLKNRMSSKGRRQFGEVLTLRRVSHAIKEARYKFSPHQKVLLPNGKQATVDYQDQNGVYLKEYPGSIFEPSRLSKI